jgi:hypothetical protein
MGEDSPSICQLTIENRTPLKTNTTISLRRGENQAKAFGEPHKRPS